MQAMTTDDPPLRFPAQRRWQLEGANFFRLVAAEVRRRHFFPVEVLRLLTSAATGRQLSPSSAFCVRDPLHASNLSRSDSP